MKEKIKLTDATEKFLTSKKGYKKSWFRSFAAIIFASIIIGIVMGISYNNGPFSGYSPDTTDANYWKDFNFKIYRHSDLMYPATYLCYAAIACFCTPFICGLATWMIGINQVTKSKFFHLFMWFMVMVAVLLSLIALILLIRSCIWDPVGLPPAEDTSGSEGDANTGATTQAFEIMLSML